MNGIDVFGQTYLRLNAFPALWTLKPPTSGMSELMPLQVHRSEANVLTSGPIAAKLFAHFVKGLSVCPQIG